MGKRTTTQASRTRKMVAVTLSDEARAKLAELVGVTWASKSAAVESAILEVWTRLFLTALVVLAALSGACSVPTAQKPGTSYRVYLDPSLDAASSAAVVDAVGAWVVAVPKLNLSIANSACPTGDFTSVICFRAGTAQEYANLNAGAPAGTTYLDVCWRDPGIDSATVPVFATDTSQISLHEMGHALGLQHSAAGTVMAPYVEEEPSALTAADVGQFWAIR